MDLTEAEDIKKRWQEYTEELYNKDLHDPDKHSERGKLCHSAGKGLTWVKVYLSGEELGYKGY